jgi:predicted RNA-binding Zn ribbon-like protein
VEMWDWLGEPLPIDVANTRRRFGAAYRDLWRDAADVACWARHETGRVPPIHPAEADLPALRAARDDVFAVLLATAEAEPGPPDAVGRLNALARTHPVVDQLGGAPWTGAAEGVGELIALIVHATIAFVTHTGPDRLTWCDAPSCGQFFLRRRRDQRWCGTACGTRARVARHAASRAPE